MPLIGFAEAGAGGYFDDGGFPVGKGWDEIAFPHVTDEHAYALEISGDSMLPAYRDGDVIIVSPAAPVRRGDRVVVKTSERRGDGQGAQAPDRQADRAANRSMPIIPTARCRSTTWCGSPHRLGEPVAADWQKSTRPSHSNSPPRIR